MTYEEGMLWIFGIIVTYIIGKHLSVLLHGINDWLWFNHILPKIIAAFELYNGPLEDC